MDSDVEVIKRFDNLLNLPYFIGREAVGNRIEIAAFGAEKGTTWLKMCMNYYKNKHFIKRNGQLNLLVIPDIIYNTLSPHYNIVNITSIDDFMHTYTNFYLFPNDWFCANIYQSPNDDGPTYFITKNTFCVHHFANSWLYNKKKNFIGGFGKYI